MAAINTKPFKGLLFNPTKIGNIASCVCPPYDVISNAGAYYEKNPFNAIRLELPEPGPSRDRYIAAKETMESWLKDGILEADGKETIYVYEQSFTIGDAEYLRRGFIALNKLQKERILTHEETRNKAKEDRERLITALGTFTSLVFGLYEDKEEAVESVLADSRKDTLYNFVDEESITNRFYRMTDEKDINRLTSLMETKKIYVADGHHRLDVSYRLNLDYVPLYLTSMDSKGIVILPYHRIIKFTRKRGLKELFALMDGHVMIEQYTLVDDTSPRKAAQGINKAAKPSFILFAKEDPHHFYVITEKMPLYTDNSVYDTLRNLRVSVIHTGILKNLLRIEDDEISFTQDFDSSVSLVREGTVDAAVFLPPTTVEEVKEVAEKGLYMPPKSTFFYPKILTGLVFHRYVLDR